MVFYKNLFIADLVKIKKDYQKFDSIFFFLDQLTIELIRASRLNYNINSIIYINYVNNKQYFVDINEVNKILEYCYDNFFLKVVLNDLIFLDIFNSVRNEKWFFFFFKKFFIVIKNGLERKIEIDTKFIYKAMINLSKYNLELPSEYFSFLVFFLEKIEFELPNILNKFKLYLSVSSETFSFKNDDTGRSYIRFLEYCDLDYYLYKQKKSDFNALELLDLSLQYIILICFKNATFSKKPRSYIDNSHIKRLTDDYNKIPEIEL